MSLLSEAKVTIAKFLLNMSRFDTIMNGSDTTDVALDNGTVPTIRKLYKYFLDTFGIYNPGGAFSPFDRGAGGRGQTIDTLQLQACVDKFQQLQASDYITHGTIAGRGGTFKIDKTIKLSGSPYQLTFEDMAIIPATGFNGPFFDFSDCTSTTLMKFVNMTLNGYDHVQDIIVMGNKTQGTVVDNCSFYGWLGVAFLDKTTAPATENRITNNVFQGGSNNNQGTAIEIRGNDSEILDNVIYNINVGIRTLRGSINISRNHVYSVNANSPVAMLIADTGDQMCINDNYIDLTYLFINNPSNIQINDNKFFMTGTVNGFFPIIFKPTQPNQTLQNVSIKDNNFSSLFATYYPVNVDTSIGTIGLVYQTYMTDNTFYGYVKQSTEPRGYGTVSNVSFVGHNFSQNIPWGNLKRIWGGAINPDSGKFEYVTTQSITGSVGFLTFSNNTSGKYTLQGTVNDDFI